MGINKNNYKKQSLVLLIIYTFAFFLVWAMYEIYFRNIIHNESTLLSIIIRNSIKIIVWTAPVLILLKYYYKNSPILYLKLNCNITNAVVWGTSIGLLIIIYNVIWNYIFGTGKFNFNFGIYRWIHHIILIGFTEEIVFRGFILQKAQELTGFWVANIISSVLFLLIHFPRWYKDGLLQGGFFNLLSAMVFVIVFSLVQGYILKRTKSLWSCMITHSISNIISIAMVL